MMVMRAEVDHGLNAGNDVYMYPTGVCHGRAAGNVYMCLTGVYHGRAAGNVDHYLSLVMMRSAGLGHSRGSGRY